MTTRPHLAYLHGFASSPHSKKGRAIAEAFAAQATAPDQVDLLDLNRPDFATLTLTAQLEAVTAWAADKTRVSLIGSSMGGWVATRFAELNPSKIEGLVLLAPAFDMTARWPRRLGAQAMAAWRAHGALPFPDADGRPTPVHWGFIEDALSHPPTPSSPCATLVIHGRADEVVPIESSRQWVAAQPEARLIEVEDGHELAASVPLIIAECLAMFGAPQ